MGTSRVSYFSARGKQLASIEGLGSTLNGGAGVKTTYSYDNLDRLQAVIAPEGNYTSFTYDDFGPNPWANNVTAVNQVSKPIPSPTVPRSGDSTNLS